MAFGDGPLADYEGVIFGGFGTGRRRYCEKRRGSGSSRILDLAGEPERAKEWLAVTFQGWVSASMNSG